MKPHFAHHHHHRGRHHRRMTPLGRFVRSKLHRRLFMWFGASILVTAVVVIGAMSLLSRVTESYWAKDVGRVQAFMGNQFARVWDVPSEREALAASMAKDLDLDIALQDATGLLLLRIGEPCRKGGFQTQVRRQEVVLGQVVVCFDRHHAMQAWKLLLPVVLAICVLWAASGRIARRLARPLSELSSVVQQIGAGNLTARASESCGQADEIGVVAEAVNEMAARIEKQLADQRELLAAVSHELRTPLARIRLLTEMARDNGATAKTFDDLDREVIEIDALVGELLANSRIDFAALSVRPLQISDLSGRALERGGLEASQLVVEADQREVYADATLLLRALANLIDNAKKHGGGLERLVVRSKPGFVVFEAEDRGPGLAPGDEDRVFQPFHRKTNGQERAEGSLGLGLALVKRIAVAHGGNAYARNRPEGGACVGLELPHPAALGSAAGDDRDLA